MDQGQPANPRPNPNERRRILPKRPPSEAPATAVPISVPPKPPAQPIPPPASNAGPPPPPPPPPPTIEVGEAVAIPVPTARQGLRDTRAIPVTRAVTPRGPSGTQRLVRPPVATEPIAVGVGKFDVADELGRGGMGVVRAAMDRTLRRDLAIKTLIHADEPASREKFVEEAQITGQLQHPNIVPVYELGEDSSGQLFLAMKRVRGREFAEVIAEAHAEADGNPTAYLPVLRRLLDVFLKVCDAVAFAHARGVIHRDLKPHNVMVGEFGEVLVMDWGLAKPIGQAERDSTKTTRKPPSTPAAPPTPATVAKVAPRAVTSDRRQGEAVTLQGAVMGTPAYMSPEQASGMTANLDEGADIFSLGGILYTILTNELPVKGSTTEDQLSAVREYRLIPPKKRTPKIPIPGELEAVVLKAMARRRRDRYADVAALRADVETFLTGGMLSAVEYSWWQRGRKFVRKHRTATIGAVAVLLVAVAGIISAVKMAEDAREAEIQRAESEMQGYLAAREAEWAEVESALQATANRVAQRQFQAAIAEYDAFGQTFGETIETLKRNDPMRRHRPDLIAEIENATARVETARREAIFAWAKSALPSVAPAAARDPLLLSDVERAFSEFLPFLSEPAMPTLPVAELAQWRAEAAFAANDIDTATRWVAKAYVAQPHSEAAGRAFLRLADHLVADGHYRQAATLYHRTLSGFQDTFPALMPQALMGLGKSLGQLGFTARTPFAPEVSAREMALRALLRLVTPQGELRREMAAHLPAAERAEFAREAADWVFALRRMTVGAPMKWQTVLDLDRDGVPDAVGVVDGLRVRLLRPVVPADPLAPMDWRETMTFDFDALMRAEFPDEVTDPVQIYGPWPVWLRVEQDRPWYVFAISNRVKMTTRVIMLTETSPLKPNLSVVEKPHGGIHPWGVCVADVDGNGHNDLVIGFGHYTRRVRVAFQTSPGNFEYEPLTAIDVTGSSDDGDVTHVFAGDFNGNGATELIVYRGPWNQFALEAYSVRQNQLSRRLDRVVIGDCNLIVRVETPTGPLLGIAPNLSPQTGASFASHDVPPLDFRWWKLSGEKLTWLDRATIPRQFDARGETIRGGSAVAFVADRGVGALIESEYETDEVTGRRASRLNWHFWPAEWPTNDPPRTIRIANATATGPGIPRVTMIDGHACRELDDDALAQIARSPVPTQPDFAAGYLPLRVARTFVDIGLWAEAARLIADEMADTARWAAMPAEVKLDLQRLDLHGRIHRGNPAGIHAWLNRTAPIDGLVAEAVVAAEALAERLENLQLAAGFLDRWAELPSLPASLRDKLRVRSGNFRALADRMARPAIDWQGKFVRTADGNQHALSDYLLGNSPSILSPSPNDPTTINVIATAQRTMVWQPNRETGGATPIPMVGGIGMPVRYRGGSFRMVLDFRIHSIQWDCAGLIGLFETRQLVTPGSETRWVAGMRVSMGGGNNLHACYVGAGASQTIIDTRIESQLRLDMVYRADTGNLHVTVVDRDRRDVIFDHAAPFEPPPPGTYLLGASHNGTSALQSELDLHRVYVAGNFELISPMTPEVILELATYSDVIAVSAAVRGKFSGNPTAPRELAQIRADWARPLIEQPTDGPQIWHPMWAIFELAWEQSGYTADGFAAQLTAHRIGTDRGTLGHLANWMASKPTFSPPPGLWEGAGMWLAREVIQVNDSSDDNPDPDFVLDAESAILAITKAIIQDSVHPVYGLIISPWVLSELPTNPTALELQFHCVHEMMHGRTFSGHTTLGLLPLALGLRLPDTDAARQFRTQAAYWLMLHCRRQLGMQLAARANPPTTPRLFENQRLVVSLRDRQLAEQMRRVATRGAIFPDIPPFSRGD